MASRSCDDSIARIYEYLDDEIGWYSRVRIRYHLRKCPNCTGAFSFEERLKIVVRERAKEEPPPEFMDRLRSFLEQSD